jgi:hypothetical protein
MHLRRHAPLLVSRAEALRSQGEDVQVVPQSGFLRVVPREQVRPREACAFRLTHPKRHSHRPWHLLSIDSIMWYASRDLRYVGALVGGVLDFLTDPFAWVGIAALVAGARSAWGKRHRQALRWTGWIACGIAVMNAIRNILRFWPSY